MQSAPRLQHNVMSKTGTVAVAVVALGAGVALGRQFFAASPAAPTPLLAQRPLTLTPAALSYAGR